MTVAVDAKDLDEGNPSARRLSGADRRHARRPSRADLDTQAAYRAGLDGLEPGEGWNQTERRAYEDGVAERRERLLDADRRHARTITEPPRREPRGAHPLYQAGARLRRVGQATIGRRNEIPVGGGGTWWGVVLGVLALIALYLLLTRSGLAAKAINGVTGSVGWLIAPSVLPF